MAAAEEARLGVSAPGADLKPTQSIQSMASAASSIESKGGSAVPADQSSVDHMPAASPAPRDNGLTRAQTVLVMLSLCSALFLSALDVTIVTVAIPTIAEDFQSTIGYTWIGSAYMLANAATAPSWGKISDIWGRKPIILVAVGVFWTGSLLCAVSVNMAMLIAARAVQGIGGGGISILVNICISDLFSMRKRGQYLSITSLVWAAAASLGPVVGGAFTQNATWRWCFYLNLPISGLGFLLLVFVLRLHDPQTPLRAGLAAVDWLGSITVIFGTLLVLLALTLGGVVYPWVSPTVLGMLSGGALLLAAFGYVEARVARYPIVPVQLFRQRASVAAFVCGFFHGIVYVSGSYYLPLYFQAVLGARPLMSGIYVLPFSLGISVASASTGIAIRTTGKYLVFIVGGFVLLTTGFGLFTALGATPSLPRIVLFQLVAALGAGPNTQSILLALHTTVERRDMAAATATFGFIRQLSTTASVVLGGVVFQNAMQCQHADLVARIGASAADLLSGRNAASSVYLVDRLTGDALTTARAAYWTGIRSMFVMYAALAGVGLVTSLFIRQTTLSTVHIDHKTGLAGMRARDEATEPEAMPEAAPVGQPHRRGTGSDGERSVAKSEV